MLNTNLRITADKDDEVDSIFQKDFINFDGNSNNTDQKTKI
jgi:hypothetical protein